MTSGAPAAEAEGREPDGASDGERGLSGRGGWHLVTFLAALVLVLAMSLDWYTTEQGEEFRRVEEVNRDRDDSQRLDSEDVERAAQAAEAQEKNAFQADALVDRLILLVCLAAFAAAVATAFMRSIGRRPDPPWNPAALATVAGILATLLIVYRMIQPPGFNEAAVVKPGVPIALMAVGVLTVAARLATLIEREERLGPAAAARPDSAREKRGSPRSARGKRRRLGRRTAPPEAPPSAPGAAPPLAPGAAPPPPAAEPWPAAPAPPEPEPERAPGALWAPPPASGPPRADTDPFGPVEDPSAQAREARRLARERARAARGGAPDPEQRDEPDR